MLSYVSTYHLYHLVQFFDVIVFYLKKERKRKGKAKKRKKKHTHPINLPKDSKIYPQHTTIYTEQDKFGYFKEPRGTIPHKTARGKQFKVDRKHRQGRGNRVQFIERIYNKPSSLKATIGEKRVRPGEETGSQK